jgi:hypothetical protein
MHEVFGMCMICHVIWILAFVHCGRLGDTNVTGFMDGYVASSSFFSGHSC